MTDLQLSDLIQEARDVISSLRDFVAEGGSRRMIGATEAIIEADKLCDVLWDQVQRMRAAAIAKAQP